MVRAGVVSHPVEWAHSGYREIQEPPKRYAVIDLEGLAALCGFTDLRGFQGAHRQWVEQALENACAPRDDRWSEAIAVGSLPFVETSKMILASKPRIVKWYKQMEPMRCASQLKPMRPILPAKMRL